MFDSAGTEPGGTLCAVLDVRLSQRGQYLPIPFPALDERCPVNIRLLVPNLCYGALLRGRYGLNLSKVSKLSIVKGRNRTSTLRRVSRLSRIVELSQRAQLARGQLLSSPLSLDMDLSRLALAVFQQRS